MNGGLKEFYIMVKALLEIAQSEDRFFEPNNYIWIVGDKNLRPYVNIVKHYVSQSNGLITLFGIRVQLNNIGTDDPNEIGLYRKVK